MKPILKLQDASKIYRQGGVKTVGIEAVNLEIYPSRFCLLLQVVQAAANRLC